MSHNLDDYGFSFLQKINNQYDLYANGHRRAIVPRDLGQPIMFYLIHGREMLPLSWSNIKDKTSPLEQRI